HLLPLAAGGAAGGRYLQEAVERMAFIVAKLAQDRGELHGALERCDDLVEVALRGRQACLVLFQNVADGRDADWSARNSPIRSGRPRRSWGRRCRAYRRNCPGRAAADSRFPCPFPRT